MDEELTKWVEMFNDTDADKLDENILDKYLSSENV